MYLVHGRSLVFFITAYCLNMVLNLAPRGLKKAHVVAATHIYGNQKKYALSQTRKFNRDHLHGSRTTSPLNLSGLYVYKLFCGWFAFMVVFCLGLEVFCEVCNQRRDLACKKRPFHYFGSLQKQSWNLDSELIYCNNVYTILLNSLYGIVPHNHWNTISKASWE